MKFLRTRIVREACVIQCVNYRLRLVPLSMTTGGAQHAVESGGELAEHMAKRGQQAPSIFFEWPEKRGALPPP